MDDFKGGRSFDAILNQVGTDSLGEGGTGIEVGNA